MKNHRRKRYRAIFSVLVSLMLILTMLPNQLVLAADDGDVGQQESVMTEQQTVENGETGNTADQDSLYLQTEDAEPESTTGDSETDVPSDDLQEADLDETSTDENEQGENADITSNDAFGNNDIQNELSVQKPDDSDNAGENSEGQAHEGQVEVIFTALDGSQILDQWVTASQEQPAELDMPAHTQDGLIWVRADENGDGNVTITDGVRLTNLTGPGPVIFAEENDEFTEITEAVPSIAGLPSKLSVRRAAQSTTAAANGPATSKTLTDNGDGTYTLSLSVTGRASQRHESNKADVVIILDVSGSMSYGSVNSRYYGSDDPYSNNPSRLVQAKVAVNDLAKSLLANNTTKDPDRVRLSLVSFSDYARVRATDVTSYNSFAASVNSLRAKGGTNWEDALLTANNISLRSDADQYVIFVSDGDPTFRLTRGGKEDEREDQRQNIDGHIVYGSGNSDYNGKNYKYALIQAQNIVNSGKNLYTLNVYGDAVKMAKLASESGAKNNFDARDNDAVKAAFDTIVNQINATFSYKNCAINDGVTDLTSKVLLDGQADGFTYQRSGATYGDGQEWTDAPQASFTNGQVSWNLGDMQLEDGVTYTVSFRVWPSQAAFDLVADLNNGLKTYDSLTDSEKQQIVALKDGGYGLKTNTEAKVDYTELETLDTEHLPEGAVDNGDGTWTANGYTFTQQADGTYSGIKVTQGQDEIDEPDPISLTNTKLSVRKVWTDDLDDSARPDSITVKVTRDGKTYIPVELSAANNWEGYIYVAPGLMAGGDMLEDGHDYSILEEGSNNHYEVSTEVFHPTIVDGVLKDSQSGDSVLTVTNTLKGRLKISKTVTASDGLTAPDKEFSFKVTLTDKDGKNLDAGSLKITYTVTHKDGTVSQPAQLGQDGLIRLKDGESATIVDIPCGNTYKIEEIDLPEGFALTQTTGNAQGKIVSDTVEEAAFTNSYAVRETSVDLGVAKSLDYDGDVSLPDITGKFTFTLTAITEDAPMPDTTVITNTEQKGTSASFGTVTFTKPGTYQYKITESGTVAGITNDAQAESGKLITVTVTDDGKGQLKASASDKDGIVTFTNLYQEGSLKIEKKLEGNDVDPQKEFTFTVRLTGYDFAGDIDGVSFNNGVGSLTLKGGESKILHHLPAGITYTVTEADYSRDGYTCSQPDGFTGTIENKTEKDLTFVNTRNSFGSLKVTKTVNGNDADTDKAFRFTVTLSDDTVSGAHGDMTFTGGKASFELKDGESKTASDLPNGVTYTVAEADYSSEGYETQSSGEKGTITGNGTKNAKFVNTRDTYGSIVISKTVSGNDTDAGKSFEFTVTLADKTINGTFGQMTFANGVATVSLTGGSSVEADGLPNGLTFTVEEKDYSGEGYESSLKAPYTGTVKGNAVVTVDVTNTRNTYGSLTVTKKVDGNDADTNKTFAFTVTLSDTTITGTFGEMEFTDGVASFTLKDGQSKTAQDLPNGVTYTVTEDDYTSDGYSVSKTGDTGSIVGNAEAEASFVNTRNTYGSLTVSKTVKGNDADTGKEFSFMVTLSDAAISGQYGDMKFMDGKAQFTLKDGGSVTANGLPNGIGYTVTEADYSADGYVTESEGEQGTIDDETPAIAAFTNTRNKTVTYGSLTISKVVEGKEADLNQYFDFTVTFDKEGTYSYSGSKSGTITSGGTIQLKHGESITITGIESGTYYTVTEGPADGYLQTATDRTGYIKADQTSHAQFVNTKSVGPKTGDEQNAGMWGAIGILSAALAAALAVMTKRKEKAE